MAAVPPTVAKPPAAPAPVQSVPEIEAAAASAPVVVPVPEPAAPVAAAPPAPPRDHAADRSAACVYGASSSATPLRRQHRARPIRAHKPVDRAAPFSVVAQSSIAAGPVGLQAAAVQDPIHVHNKTDPVRAGLCIQLGRNPVALQAPAAVPVSRRVPVSALVPVSAVRVQGEPQAVA